MLLDCEARTLTVYLNGVRLGDMVKPGMRYIDGTPIHPLKFPVCWSAEFIRGNACVAIRGPLPLPADVR